MFLTENLNILAKDFPDVYKKFEHYKCLNNNIEIKVEIARNRVPTILYKSDASSVYIHSKYDPIAEAERFICQYSDIDRYKLVFFYGVGMGYHIEKFCRNGSDKKYILYEPEQDIFFSFLKERRLAELPLGNCKGIYTGNDKKDIEYLLQKFVDQIKGEVLFIALPSYERIFAEEYKAFIEAFHRALKSKRASLQTRMSFQKLWVQNSIRNLSEVINSPNILQNKRHYFTGKPAIIAAAGPSLVDELENLRFIKEKGLAYIFSVGSAINTLIENDVLSDAVCIYDPAANTAEVVRKVREKGLDIPLVFGSSVYYGALRDYPGSKFHILNSQDTVSAYFLKAVEGRSLERIIDAPSVAIIALQLLVNLGCSPIILAGQNFAFRNNRYYARGIEYKGRPGEICNLDQENAVETEDVYGGRVQTSRLFNHMRNQMEMYIDYCGRKDIVNTTKGGAKIKGTVYKPLEELLKKELVKRVVDTNWIEDNDFSYDIDYMISQGKLILTERKAAEELTDILADSVKTLEMEKSITILQAALNSFETAYNKLVKNSFFNHVLWPMNRVQFEMIAKNIEEMPRSKDVKDKADFIIETFGDVFECCKRDMDLIRHDFDGMLDEIFENDIKVMSFTICFKGYEAFSF
jgi:hypothetical protein